MPVWLKGAARPATRATIAPLRTSLPDTILTLVNVDPRVLHPNVASILFHPMLFSEDLFTHVAQTFFKQPLSAAATHPSPLGDDQVNSQIISHFGEDQVHGRIIGCNLPPGKLPPPRPPKSPETRRHYNLAEVKRAVAYGLHMPIRTDCTDRTDLHPYRPYRP